MNIHPDNGRKIVRVLHKFGFDDPAITIELFLKADQVIRMGVPPLRIELITNISGVEFQVCHPRRTTDILDGVSVDLIGADLAFRELEGDTPADRVSSIMFRVGDVVSEHPQMAAAAITALLSHDEEVLRIFDRFHEAIERWIALAIGDAPNRSAVVELLEHLLWASLIALVRGRDTPDSVRDRMVLAARMLLRDPATP